MCTNGDISLGSEYTEYTPEAFPLASDTTLICPYWADGDPRVGGFVYSRITRDSSLLQQFSQEGRIYEIHRLRDTSYSPIFKKQL